MSTLLAIDTTIGACSAALLKDDTIIAEMMEVRARGHVERLIPMVDEVCCLAQADLKELDAIAVTIGPGTFAGVRIGLSAAKGMALALDIPIIAVTSLQALAYEYAQDHLDLTNKITVCVDARRGEFYTQSFEIDKGKICETDHAQAVPLDMMLTKNNDALNVIGSGAAYMESSENFAEGYLYPKATMVAQYAASHFDKRINPDKVSPLYLRAPDAKPPSSKNIPVIKND
ncbi:MAG: tRNA (adenosine(37)-N6)-threonylcarbamoyltransferase complex dimerization subunit type 1 TsaB [Emcibacteraceae bacterium]|nr:tRNA (adenosine(37)-N6)-threonylcarbamoyltransferase complex dimerization subunit type 1 TsaB [Emcibacteraceae bacterium]